MRPVGDGGEDQGGLGSFQMGGGLVNMLHNDGQGKGPGGMKGKGSAPQEPAPHSRWNTDL